MKEIVCNKCYKKNIVNDNPQFIFCQYCGNKIELSNDNIEIMRLVDNTLVDKDPVRIHKNLLELESKYPYNLYIKKALLLQGRLHERNAKHLDYSVIHCYLLNIFLEGELFKGQKQQFIDELTSSPKLLECLALSENKNLFLQEYYYEISKRFIELFLMGSNKYMKQFFGLSFSRNPAKTLAEPCSRIIKSILSTSELKDYRFVLAKAFYNAFTNKFGDAHYIHNELGDTYKSISGEYIHIYL